MRTALRRTGALAGTWRIFNQTAQRLSARFREVHAQLGIEPHAVTARSPAAAARAAEDITLLVADHYASTLVLCGLDVEETDQEVLRLRGERKREAERVREAKVQPNLS